MARIKSLEINSYRAFQHLKLSDFSDINLVVGDNNSGKTSLLESIQLLYADPQVSSIRNVISQRSILKSGKSNFYEAFIKMFNIEESPDKLHFDIKANSDNGNLGIHIIGKEESISYDAAKNLIRTLSGPRRYRNELEETPEQIKHFIGNVVKEVGDESQKREIQVVSYGNGLNIYKKNKVEYIASFGHMRYDLLQNIVNNLDYKRLVIDILRQFDEDIEDICYTKADDGSFYETVITSKGSVMPFSVYGDGIKKILYIINKTFDAADSILLIDEIETGLHRRYYEMLLPVVFALAKKLNVQLFITTHSMEVIDAILEYGKYEDYGDEKNSVKKDPIKVITLKKINTDNGSNILARNLDGKYVYDNRKVFNFEVRL